MNRFLLSCLLILTAISTSGQKKDDQNPREMFLEAESYLLYEEFSEALPLYLKLQKADPENDNLNFKVGLCYLNIPFEKEKAIGYLQKAVKSISPDYNPNSFKERKAPLDALFYLGNAYRVNNMFEKALETYDEFKSKSNSDSEVYDISLVNDQIKCIERANNLMSRPIYYVRNNVGEPVNSRFEEKNAVVSGDEKTLVYNVKLQFYDALFYSKKVNGRWTAPINIIPELGVDGDVYATGLSYGGTELYIYRNDNYDGNLYVTRLVNGKWTPLTRLGENINTKYWESHASLSSDGKTLVFTSNRKPGFGGLDIYTATRNDTNKILWTNIRNVGSNVNSEFNEETPFLSQDGKVLFYSSYGHYNMGGYDIFYSTLLNNGTWSTPLNMGYPLNTSDDDLFFIPVQNGDFAYITRYYPDNFGKTDIYKVELFSDQHPRKFILNGIISIKGTAESNSKIKISLINKKDTIKQISIDQANPNFVSEITAGNYQMVVEGDGFKKTIENITIDKNQKESQINVSSELKPEEVAKAQVSQAISTEPESIEFDKTFYKVENDSVINIIMPLEAGTSVAIMIENEKESKHEKVKIQTDNQIYKYKPVEGKNQIIFNAITPEGIKKHGTIIIYYTPVDTTEAQSATELAMKKREMNYSARMLPFLLPDSAKECLAELNSEENITSYVELSDFLKTKQSCSSLIPLVDSALKHFDSIAAALSNSYAIALSQISDGRLKQLADSSAAKKFASVNQLSDYLIYNTIDNSADYQQLISNTARLAWQGNAYYYLQNLKKVTSGNLRATLDSVDLSKQKITTGSQLLGYLYAKKDKNLYKEEDIYSAFFALPNFTTIPLVLLNGMAMNTDENNKDFFESNKKLAGQTKTIESLGTFLHEKSLSGTANDSIILFALVKANEKEYLKEVIADLKHFSSKVIKENVSFDELEKNNFSTIGEIVNYLFVNNDSVKNEIIRTFAQIGTKNIHKMNQFEPHEFKPGFFTATNIALVSIFFVLMLGLVIYMIRKKSNNTVA